MIIIGPAFIDSLPTPAARDSQAVVASQLVQLVRKVMSKAVASSPPAMRVQITAEVSVQGTLATINLAKVRAAIDNAIPSYSVPPFTDPTSPDHPEKDAFRVRVVVCANKACPADGPGLERPGRVGFDLVAVVPGDRDALGQHRVVHCPSPRLVGFSSERLQA